MIAGRLDQPDRRRGYLLDGHPRMAAQAVWLQARVAAGSARQVMVHLKVDYNEVIACLTGRRHCPACGAVYNLATNPPRQDGICDGDVTPLAWREDDRSDVIAAWWREYERQTGAVLNALEAGPMLRVELEAGSAQPAEIAERILQRISCA